MSQLHPFDPSPYITVKNSLRTSHGREFLRNGWKGPGEIFRGRDVETAKTIDDVPIILIMLRLGRNILEITPDFIVFDLFCGDKKFFAKNGPTEDYLEYGGIKCPYNE